MSASLAAARKRRGVAAPEPPQVVQQQAPPQPAGLTLPQVIALVDKRLIALETYVKEQKESSSQNLPQVQQSANVQSINNDILKNEIENIAEEFNNRYELLAAEIQSIKDIVLKLQSYTMEVNKTLMEERFRILSDVDNSANIRINEEVVVEDS